MTKWAYVATPYGAPLYQTLRLARGQIIAREKGVLFDRCGIIFRELCDRNKRPIEIIKQLRPGDDLLLMYDFAHSGVIYPVQQFKILDPDDAIRRIKFPVEKEGGYPAIGRINVDSFVQINFVPDYLEPEDVKNSKFQNVICIERHNEWLPRDKVGMVVIGSEKHALAVRELNKLKFVPEQHGMGVLEEAYKANAKNAKFESELYDEHKTFWKSYNGWVKMMLYENKAIEAARTRSLGDIRFENHAFEALPLCSIFEYLLNMMLKKEADSLILEKGEPLFERTELSVFPESTIERTENCASRIELITKFVEMGRIRLPFGNQATLKNLLHDLRKFRNRIAHSYFIEQRHYQSMKTCVHDLLKMYSLI